MHQPTDERRAFARAQQSEMRRAAAQQAEIQNLIADMTPVERKAFMIGYRLGNVHGLELGAEG